MLLGQKQLQEEIPVNINIKGKAINICKTLFKANI